MTLTVHNEIEQGTPEWDDVRRGILTASVIGQFITPKTVKPAANDKTRAMAYQLVAERITGITVDTYASRDMEAGHTEEPIARDYYSANYAPAEVCGFMVREFDGYRIGYSPDGVVVSDNGLIEVKRREPKRHLADILANEVPAENMAQCQTGLLVSGYGWLDYVSFCGGMKLWRKRVFPDPIWFDAIHEVAQSFETSAATMTAGYHALTADMPDTERVPELEEMRF